jgi:hypothetical protein
MVTLPLFTDLTSLKGASDSAPGEPSSTALGDPRASREGFWEELASSFPGLKGEEKGRQDPPSLGQPPGSAMTSLMTSFTGDGEDGKTEAVPCAGDEDPPDGWEGGQGEETPLSWAVPFCPSPEKGFFLFSIMTPETVNPENPGGKGPSLQDMGLPQPTENGFSLAAVSYTASTEGAERASFPAGGPAADLSLIPSEQAALKEMGSALAKEDQGRVSLTLKTAGAVLSAPVAKTNSLEGERGETPTPVIALGGGTKGGAPEEAPPLDLAEGPPVKGGFLSEAFQHQRVEEERVEHPQPAVLSDTLSEGVSAKMRVLSVTQDQGTIPSNYGKEDEAMGGPSAWTVAEGDFLPANKDTFTEKAQETKTSSLRERLFDPSLQRMELEERSVEPKEGEGPVPMDGKGKTPPIIIEKKEGRSGSRVLPVGRGPGDVDLPGLDREGRENLLSPVPEGLDRKDAGFLGEERGAPPMGLQGDEAGASAMHPSEALKGSPFLADPAAEAASLPGQEKGQGKPEGLGFPSLAVVQRSLEGLLFPNRVFQVRHGDGTTVELVLDPDGLGQVEVELNLTRDLLQGQITVQDPTQKELIERNLPLLMNDLLREGLQVGGFTVSLKQREKGFSEGEEEPPKDERNPSLPAPAAVQERPISSHRVHIIV